MAGLIFLGGLFPQANWMVISDLHFYKYLTRDDPVIGARDI